MHHTSSTMGQIAFLGSGETAYSGGRIFESLAKNLPQPLRIAILETPAGFELNASQVAGRVGDYLKTRLQNYKPEISLVPARKRGTPFGPDDPEIIKPLLTADLIFMGAGSPTYAVRQLQGSLAWDVVRARHRLGATLVFASAAAVAVSAAAIPVYEIFKVGEDVHGKPGLDLFSAFGLDITFVPHWNNAEGGEDVDTSRCFIGLDRFDEFRSLLAPGHVIIGLDEHTGLIWDVATGVCRTSGVGAVTVLKEDEEEVYPNGSSFDIRVLGDCCTWPEPEDDIPAEVWELVRSALDVAADSAPPAEVQALADRRQKARLDKDWAESDRLRDEIAALGWTVQDTPEGPKLVKGN
ncbi:MAG: cysteinyl-tRNA synthetase [Chloroflexota bacterium]